jgi:DNA polymerase III subunit gamma/tau
MDMKDTYRALTRAYRPQSFDDIVAQDHVSSTLRNAIRSDRLSHAYMFCGPRGVGKTTMARVLAREVNQVDSTVDGESLGHTLNIVEMDAASNRKIEDVRSLKEVIRVPPQNGRFKIFIIDEVHMLTKEAFNALLKTLEEPPSHAIFIFATTEPHKVLPTILSRVQRFDFKRISVDEIVERLRMIASKEAITIDDESLHVIAKRADGALRDALGLMDQAIAFCGTDIEHTRLLDALNVVGVDDLFAITEAVADRNPDASLELVHRLVQSGTDIQEFLVSLTEHLRNLYVARKSERLSLIEATKETRERYLKHSSVFGEEDLLRMLHLVNETQLQLRDARQPRVQFEILILKLVHMNRARDLNTLIGELQSLKKKAPDNLSDPDPGTDSDTHTGATDSSRMTQGSPNGKQSPDSNGRSIVQPNEDRPLKPNRSSDSGSADSDESPEETPASGGLRRNQTSHSPSADADLYGKPSLGREPGGSQTAQSDTTVQKPASGHAEKSRPSGKSASGRKPEEQAPESVSTTEDTRPVPTLDLIDEHWEQLLEELKLSAPRTLYFQMQRIRIRSVKGRELLVSADNEFARQLLEENRKLIFVCIKNVYGLGLTIQCQVERKEESRGETLSPYERFKELQQKDPRIRKLVELFGAELEY